ncbi:MAG: hypothetical protein DLM72_13775 [Candidatus Nitrosopolaris wilkensis]|nr:MAG: hypothetical protein DLM72_13775 [Candidatus Nitrosopolaris wilkensis]
MGFVIAATGRKKSWREFHPISCWEIDSMKRSHPDKHKRSTSKKRNIYRDDQERKQRKERKDTLNYLTLALKDLNYCLNTLKINKDKDTQVRQKINKFFEQAITTEAISTYGERIATMNVIADFYFSSTSRYIFSQSELYDFLTLATQGLPTEQRRDRAIERVFMIYSDIMENYQTSNDSLRFNYPKIIVDVIAILHAGEDTSGKRVGVNALDEYYNSRKIKGSSEVTSASAAAVQINTTLTADFPADQFEKDQIRKEQLIETIVQITGRKNKDIRESLAKLHSSDIKKISDLCANYNKIEKYCKLATNSSEFRDELEKELGRKLTDNQVQRATTSIKKVRKYVENLLDGKFVPHGSHGINHIKHNLEYGYQVMDLIKHKRRSSK